MPNDDVVDRSQTETPPSTQNETKRDRIKAAVLFVIILAAYVTQSQLTQYVQSDLGYQQPYFIFYVAHSFFAFIFPLQLLYLTRVSGIPSSRYLSGLRLALARRLTNARTAGPVSLDYGKLTQLILGLTLGVTCPAVLWYASVAFAPISDVTALFNTNAFWAYVFSVLLASAGRSRVQWEWKKLLAVTTACVGVFAVAYGGAQNDHNEARSATTGAGTTIIGDTLALISSVCYALYQVLYKRYAALESEDEANQSPTAGSGYQALLTDDAGDDPQLSPPESEPEEAGHPHAIKPPFGFYPNFLTSMIGLTTFTVLWAPIPIMQWSGVGQPFVFPPDLKTWVGVGLIATSGLIFNSGYMILLGIWGPVITSVGNLLTIVLVLASDAFFGNGLKTITVWSLIGCSMIVSAFSILAIDVLRT